VKRPTLLLSALLSLAALLAVLSLGSCSARAGVVDGRLGPCPLTPNCVNSEEGTRGGAAVEPLSFEGPVEEAQAALLELLASEPRVSIVETQPGYVHAVYKTRLLRFRDDVEFRLDDATKEIQVRSASRLGLSDLGANRRRVEALRERWEARR